MPRINAGEGFGRVTAEPIGQAQMPANNAGRAMMQIGQRMEQQGVQQEREAAAEAQRQANELRQQREKADTARATSIVSNTRERIKDEAGRIDQEVQDGRLPKTEAAKAWKERTTELLQASLGDVPEAHRGLVQQDLQGYASRFDSNVADSVRRRDQSDTRADLDSTLEALQRSAVGNLPQSKAQAMAALDTLGPAAGLRPDEIGKAKQRWVEGAAYTGAFTALNQAKNDNRALAKVEQSLQANSDIDPQRRAQLLAQLDGYRSNNEARALRQAQQAEIAAARADRESARAWDVLSGPLLQGKQLDPAFVNANIGRLDPARLAAFKALAAEAPARAALAMQPVDAVRQRVADLTALSFTRNSPEVEKELKRAQEILKAQESGYDGKDDLRAGAQFGIVGPLAPVDMSSADGFLRSIIGRNEQAQAVETRVKRPVSRLTQEEAAKVGDWLGAMSPKAQGDFIAAAAKVMPAGALTALSKQLDERNRPLALAMAAGSASTTMGTTTAGAILRGAKAMADKRDGSVSEKGNEARQRMREEITKYVGDSLTGANLSSVVDAAMLIKTGWDADGTFESSAERAVNLALGGKIVEHKGARVPVPAGLDDLPAALRNVSERSIAAQADNGVLYLPGGRPMGVPEFLAALPDAQLVATAPGRYKVVIPGRGEVVGANRRAVVVGVK